MSAESLRDRSTTSENVLKYVVFVHRAVREEMNYIRWSHDGVTLDVDRDLSTATLLVFITLLSPDEDLQCCSRNVAINIQSDSIVRHTNEVHLLLQRSLIYVGNYGL